MTFAIWGCAFAWLAVLVGLLLAVAHGRDRRPPAWQLWLHPFAATVALVCLWAAVVRWPGPENYPFNSGVFIITLAFVAGAFLYALRRTGMRRVPAIVIIPHAVAALLGAALLIAGLLQA